MSHSHRDLAHQILWIQSRRRESRFVIAFSVYSYQIRQANSVSSTDSGVYGFDIGWRPKLTASFFMCCWSASGTRWANCLLQIRKTTKSVWSENISSSFSIKTHATTYHIFMLECDTLFVCFGSHAHTVNTVPSIRTHTAKQQSRARQKHTHNRCVYVIEYGMLTMRFTFPQQTTKVCVFFSSIRFVALFVSSFHYRLCAGIFYSIRCVSFSFPLAPIADLTDNVIFISQSRSLRLPRRFQCGWQQQTHTEHCVQENNNKHTSHTKNRPFGRVN